MVAGDDIKKIAEKCLKNAKNMIFIIFKPHELSKSKITQKD